jgi:23S rRNA pseudouridine1911/1915/1917 synthase
MDIQILYEDQNVVVIQKPPGVVVNDTDTASETTIQEWWSEKLPKQNGEYVFSSSWQELVPAEFIDEFGTPEQIFKERGGIVHRLDKETSGALLLAKNPGSLVNLLLQFRQRQTEKQYLCLVHGKFQILEDTVQFPIARSTVERTKFRVMPDGRHAETRYRVVQFFPHFHLEKLFEKVKKEEKEVRKLKQRIEKGYQGFSLVECWPKTGRTHQIRVHFSHIRHPLVADPTYVGAKRLHLDQLWCGRLFLHAQQLSWNDPLTGEKRVVDAPLPTDLHEALEYLRSE